MRMSRLILHGDMAVAAVPNDPFDQLDRPIEEVHLLAGDPQPAAADDPRAPPADLGQRRVARIIDQTLHRREQAANIESGALAEVEAKIVVGGRTSGAPRARPAEHNRDRIGDGGENGCDAFQKRVGRFHLFTNAKLGSFGYERLANPVFVSTGIPNSPSWLAGRPCDSLKVDEPA